MRSNIKTADRYSTFTDLQWKILFMKVVKHSPLVHISYYIRYFFWLDILNSILHQDKMDSVTLTLLRQLLLILVRNKFSTLLGLNDILFVGMILSLVLQLLNQDTQFTILYHFFPIMANFTLLVYDTCTHLLLMTMFSKFPTDNSCYLFCFILDKKKSYCNFLFCFMIVLYMYNCC